MKDKRSTRRPRRRTVSRSTMQETRDLVSAIPELKSTETAKQTESPLAEDARRIEYADPRVTERHTLTRPAPEFISRDLERANDLFVQMVRAQSKWMRALDLYDNIDARHEDFMDAQQKIHAAYSEYHDAVAAYRRTVAINGDLSEL